jgi:hypothetical protein
MDNLMSKDIHLNLEMETSIKLIKIGLKEYQNISMSNDFYYIPFQLLSNGIERLMKCYLCLGYHENNNNYPDIKILKGFGGKTGHDLLDLKSTISSDYFNDSSKALKDDKRFIEFNPELEIIINLLSEFGKYARYYNFDIITSAKKTSININEKWSEFETDFSQKLKKSDIPLEFSSVQKYIIVKIERFIRALCRQFTLGELRNKAKSLSSYYSDFLKLSDSDLGLTKY